MRRHHVSYKKHDNKKDVKKDRKKDKNDKKDKEKEDETPKKGAACGDLDWPCCDAYGPEGGKCPKGDNLACMDGYCRVAKCGDIGWACCRPDGPEGGECPKVRQV